MPPLGMRDHEFEGRSKESNGWMDENLDKDPAMAILAAIR
jgi:hypothetical protein